MGKLKDKVVGKTKQAVAEIIGDGKSNEEGAHSGEGDHAVRRMATT
jgi:hypothetical protein